MDGGLGFEVERASATLVLQARGVLDAYTAPELRTALLACVAEQPPAVVIDASGLTVADEVGLTVVAGVAREAERWPGTKFAVFGGGDFIDAAERIGLARQVPVRPDRETAVRAVAQVPVPPLARVRIAPDRDAPGRARAAVVAFCNELGVGGDGDAAQLVASELVTNAVVHVGTDIDLTLRLVPPFLHIAVRDYGAGRPRIAGLVDESAESGRGLLLVDTLAASWSSFFPNVGKIVWAQVRVRPTGASPVAGL